MPIRPAVRALLIYLVAQTVVLTFVFLYVASFFASWDGLAVGVLPPAGERPSIYEVVIADKDGDKVVRNMPADVALGMDLPVLQYGIMPDPIPDTAPRSRKSQFTLNYLVQRRATADADYAWQSYPTTTPQALGLVVIMSLIGLGLRNMVYAGSPVWIERETAFLPKALVQAGSVAGTETKGRKGPPPAKSQRGPRRGR